jgi:hypothetical protein
MAEYDRSSKWLISRHGDVLLRLAGVKGIRSFRPAANELVHPSQTPDGLLEVDLEGHDKPVPHLIEVGTYADRRMEEQLLRDVALCSVVLRTVPEAIAVAICPRVTYDLAGSLTLHSASGATSLSAEWKVVELWNTPVAELIAWDDPGAVPWYSACKLDSDPEPIFRRGRDLIDLKAPPEEKANLLAVSQVIASLRYNNPALLAIFGGPNAMIESPLVREIEERSHAAGLAEGLTLGKAQGLTLGKGDSILHIVRLRFGSVPDDLVSAIAGATDDRTLDGLLDLAVRANDVTAFRRNWPHSA